MNWTAKLATIFVRNRRLSLLLLIALFVWGGLSYLATPKQYNPRIVAPAFQIFVEFPGASRSEVLEQLTRPMENVLADLPGVEDIFTVTEAGGRVAATVNFFVGEDLDSAKIRLDDAVRSNLDLSPLGIEAPLIQSVDPDDVPVWTIALRPAAGARSDPVALRKLGFRVRERLVQVPGATNVEVVGGRTRELSIQIDPERLARSGVGISAIQNALRSANVFLPTGEIKGADRYIPIEADARVRRAADLKDIIVVTGDFGQILLRDVATVREQESERESHVRHLRAGAEVSEDASVVLISAARNKDANISDVTTALGVALVEIERELLAPNINAEVIVDEGRTAREEIDGLIANLFTAIAIVVVILFWFLDARAAVLVAISIPLTLACVFGAGYLFDQNINRITLFALILSLGLLVDNATVVIENIVRRLQSEGLASADPESKTRSIIEAVGEVGPGLFMSTVTTVLAFLPMAFVTGMMGPYMGPIPFFVPLALVSSLLLSFTINPYLASLLLAGRAPAVGAKATDSDSGRGGAFAWLRGLIPDRVWTAIAGGLAVIAGSGSRLIRFYRKLLHRIVSEARPRRILLTTVGLLLLASFALPAVGLVRFRMLPKADREQFYLYVDLPAGASLARTYAATREIERFLLEEKEIVMVQSYVGHAPILDFNGLFRGVSERRLSTQATVRVGLSRPVERSMTSEELVLELRPRLLDFADRLQTKIGGEVRLKMVEDPPGPPVLSTLLLRVQGSDPARLETIARDLRSRIDGAVDQVVDTDVSVPEDTRTLTVRIDQARASRSRLSAARIVEALSSAYDGRILGIYHNENNIEQEYIRLRLDPRFRRDRETLNRLVLYNDLGIAVPLSGIASFVETPSNKPLRRENRRNTVYVYGDMGERSITYAAIDILFLLADYAAPGTQLRLKELSLFGAEFAGTIAEPTGDVDRDSDGPADGAISVTIGGEWELTLEVFRDLGIAMGVAIFLVYFVLVAQFRSFREPLIIMATIPLSLIGVLPGFMVLGWITGEYFTATSMIGVIALAGIAVNNSIILLEYLNSLKASGMAVEAALVQAGTTRFRPILLTTVTTILGSMTIVGDPVWAGLAFAIILGLGVSSVLTLLVFPALFLIVRGSSWESGSRL
ncbi:MAG: efflux RND transporter permease subunit [bacterium]|nr:efflux RND transporter permease subunit [bacterium]